MQEIERTSAASPAPQGLAQVLIVEDEPVLRSSMVRGLARMPRVEVWNAASVAEARQILERIRPQILVCDIDLPDGVGLDVLAALDRRGFHVPVLFISAYVSTYKRSIPSRANIQVHEKPLSLVELRRLVQQQLDLPPQESESPFSPSDYIQLAAMGKHSVRLEFDAAGEPAGTIVICRGELWSAVDTQGSGEAALRRLIFSRSILGRCVALTEDPGARAFTESSQGLLLEAARLFDEEAHQDKPPLSRPPAPEGKPPCFEDLFESGVDALLRKDYAASWDAFSQAAALRPDDARVAANLKRLRTLGVAKEDH